MAKFCGEIGYSIQYQAKPGVWKTKTEARVYYGDVVKNSSRWTQSQTTPNDNISLNNQISIIADPFANQNFSSMKYAVYMGIKWKITNVDVQFPRLILTLGGVYNGG